MGCRGEYYYAITMDVIEGMVGICEKVSKEFKNPAFLIGELIFAKESLWMPISYHHSALEIQRRLVFKGLNMMVLPVRVI